jgi:hypothetical protein
MEHTPISIGITKMAFQLIGSERAPKMSGISPSTPMIHGRTANAGPDQCPRLDGMQLMAARRISKTSAPSKMGNTP